MRVDFLNRFRTHKDISVVEILPSLTWTKMYGSKSISFSFLYWTIRVEYKTKDLQDYVDKKMQKLTD